LRRPTNQSEVRACLGLINYYARFFRNLSDLLYPLNKLLCHNTKFEWDKRCEYSLNEIKRQIQSEDILTHYDTKLPIIVGTDATPYAVGAVISHIFSDGTERPIQFISQTLTATQQKYAQIDKEAYAIVFAMKKFYQYLYGRK